MANKESADNKGDRDHDQMQGRKLQCEQAFELAVPPTHAYSTDVPEVDHKGDWDADEDAY